MVTYTSRFTEPEKNICPIFHAICKDKNGHALYELDSLFLTVLYPPTATAQTPCPILFFFSSTSVQRMKIKYLYDGYNIVMFGIRKTIKNRNKMQCYNWGWGLNTIRKCENTFEILINASKN